MMRFRWSKKTGILISAKLVKLCLLALAVAGGSGCGQVGPHYIATAPEEAYGQDSGFGTFNLPGADTTQGDFKCPYKANVVPDYDRNFNGSGYFTACPSSTDKGSVLIHGETNASDTICVYPANYVDASHVYLKPDKNGVATVTCYTVGAAGVTANFPDTNFNSVFIVESQYKTQMGMCLAGGNYDFCPPYSYGLFR